MYLWLNILVWIFSNVLFLCDHLQFSLNSTVTWSAKEEKWLVERRNLSKSLATKITACAVTTDTASNGWFSLESTSSWLGRTVFFKTAVRNNNLEFVTVWFQYFVLLFEPRLCESKGILWDSVVKSRHRPVRWSVCTHVTSTYANLLGQNKAFT